MTGYKSYARTNIQTADPRAVVVLLYEGAVNFLNQAADAARRDARMEMSALLLKTLKIIQFLDAALDFDRGVEVAENLSRLYAYMRDALSEANLHCQPGKIEEVTGLFKTLLEAWREVAQCPEAAAVLEGREPWADAALPGERAAAPAAGAEPPPSREEPPGEPSPSADAQPPSPSAVQAARSAYGIR